MTALTYPERRAAALALADATPGFDKAPTPEGTRWPKRYVPAKLAARIADKRYVGPVDRYGCVRVDWNLRTAGYFEAKEKNQNREKFDN